MGKYGALEDRVRCPFLMNKVMPVEDTIDMFKDGMNLGWSGFTPAGYPKAVPIALAEHVEKNNLQGKLNSTCSSGRPLALKPKDVGPTTT